MTSLTPAMACGCWWIGSGRVVSRRNGRTWIVWLKDVAPSRELRVWFGHDPAKFEEFRRRYEAELAADPARSALAELREMARAQQVTLVFAAHDTEHCNAVVLRELLARPA